MVTTRDPSRHIDDALVATILGRLGATTDDAAAARCPSPGVARGLGFLPTLRAEPAPPSGKSGIVFLAGGQRIVEGRRLAGQAGGDRSFVADVEEALGR